MAERTTPPPRVVTHRPPRIQGSVTANRETMVVTWQAVYEEVTYTEQFVWAEDDLFDVEPEEITVPTVVLNLATSAPMPRRMWGPYESVRALAERVIGPPPTAPAEPPPGSSRTSG